jgi:2'-5' RNA ligase
MRLFVCSHVSAPVADSYDRQIGALIRAHPGRLRPVPPGSAHVTFAFLGTIPDHFVPAVVACVTPAAVRTHTAMPIHMSFPVVLFGASEARLICAPIDAGADAVTSIAHDICARLTSLEFVRDLAPFRSAHVTLARFRKRTAKRFARPLVAALADGAVREANDILRGVQIMASTLTASGPVYSVVADLPFQG